MKIHAVRLALAMSLLPVKALALYLRSVHMHVFRCKKGGKGIVELAPSELDFNGLAAQHHRLILAQNAYHRHHTLLPPLNS